MQERETSIMASPAALAEVIAHCLGMPVSSLVWYDRQLADGGLRTRSGRGRYGAQVSARDAANLLTAILGGGQVKDAIATVQRYSATIPHMPTSTKGRFTALGVQSLTRLPAKHSFLDALEALLQSLADGSLSLEPPGPSKRPQRHVGSIPLIEVAALTPGTVGDIRISLASGASANVRYALPNPFSRKAPISDKESVSWQARIKVQAASDLEQFRKVTDRTVLAISQLLAASSP